MEKIGKGEVHKSLAVLPAQFIQDKVNPAKFRIYNPNTGNMRNASKEECIGLEKAAVWEAWEIEERLQNYDENKPDETEKKYIRFLQKPLTEAVFF